jgi:fumarylacetoacetase
MDSWLDIPQDSDFSLANIPFGVASFPSHPTQPKCVTALGHYVIDLQLLEDAGAFQDIPELDANVFSHSTLNRFLEQSPCVWPQVRQRLIDLFQLNGDILILSNPRLQQAAIHDMRTAATTTAAPMKMHLPVTIREYTDFYSSREHATNVGTMFRGKDNALQPNWLHLPVGYHGRSSTVVVSGTPIRRPHGQLQLDPTDPTKGSRLGPCQRLDYELEVGFLVGGPPNAMGSALTMEQAKQRIFGFVLLNDWSARDIQKWEYVPLGPFTSKNFGTTVSPWIVTTAALQAFASATSAGVQQKEPTPLEYLQDPNYSSYNVQLQVDIQGVTQPQPHKVCLSNFKNLYWNAAQQLVHHSVTGCVMNPGDLLGSGTISGPTPDSFGSLLESSWNGSQDVVVGQETRKFLEDGDTVTIKGWCGSKPGYGRVGFGECIGKVLPAQLPSDVSSTGATPSTPTTTTSARFQNLKLYSNPTSSSTWRVRIALNAKYLEYEIVPIDLEKYEHKTPAFLEMNPMGQIPVLEYTDTQTGQVVYLTQSVAMMEFLDLVAPDEKALFPKDPMDRIVAMEMTELVNAGIQPLQNAFLWKNLEQASDGKIKAQEYQHHYIVRGLKVLETMVKRQQTSRLGPYCLGNFSPTIVDIFLIPQLYNARRFGVDVETEFPTLSTINQLCSTHPWFVQAHANAIDER